MTPTPTTLGHPSTRATTDLAPVPDHVPEPDPAFEPDPAPTHAWRLESRHATLDGVVRYVKCRICGTRRIELQPHPEALPQQITHEI